MKVIEVLKSMDYNTPITNKRVLSVLKRVGVIVDYSYWGYLESQRVYYKDDDQVFPSHEEFGKRIKNGEIGSRENPFPNIEAMIRSVNKHPTYKGIKLSYKYVDGCFCPYLVKVK